MLRFRLLAVLMFGLMASLTCLPQSDQLSPSKGTLNVLIGSKYGLVVESDSQLSFNDKPIGEGQKLFKLDDETICVIAGFYSDPGPQNLGNRSLYPLATSIPNIFGRYYREISSFPLDSFKDKVDALSESLIFNLELIALVRRASGLNDNPQLTVFTIAGFENGALKVKQIAASPVITPGEIFYTLIEGDTQILGDRLASFTAGLDDIARDMLSNPNSEKTLSRSGMGAFYMMRSEPDASGVPLSFLEQVEDSVEKQTSELYKNEVGGRKQIAILSEGKITRFESIQSESRESRIVNLNKNATFIGALGLPRNNGSVVSPVSHIGVNINWYENWIRQPLDGQIFDHSIFVGVAFDYTAQGLAFLSPSNVLIDCSLYLGPNVKADDVFVKQIAAEYPDLDIVHSGEARSVNLNEFF